MLNKYHYSLDLLVFIHKCAKDNDDSNGFSRVKDLSALFNSDVQTHNRFWFKSDLIRLIANMCYNNQEHQNLVSTSNCNSSHNNFNNT